MTYKYKENSLVYNILGDHDGFPVFLNYGLLGSTELPKSYHSLLLKEKIKLIILERPGYGESDFIQMDNYTDWNKIVEPFLDYLNIQNFAVIGISAGAPYAYAMANYFSERLTGGVYILSGLPFILDNQVLDKYTGKNRAFYHKVWNYSQEELQKEMYSIIKKYDNFFLKLILPKSFKAEVQAGLSQDCVGVAQSVRLQMNDWGFNLYDLETKVHLWHSEKDKEVPLEAVKVMIDKMKNAELFIKGKEHMPSKAIFIDILEKIKETKH